MTIPTRDQIAEMLSLRFDIHAEHLKPAADAILALFAEQTARVATFTPSDLETAIDLAVSGAPFLLGTTDWKDHSSRVKLQEAGLLTAVFPEAKPGGAGRQFWVFTRLMGRETRNGPRRPASPPDHTPCA